MSQLPIARVSEETGIPKEVLRKWEARYGFPMPERDNNDNRVYPSDQIARLHLISKLINDGKRPGMVVPLDVPSLQALLAEQHIATCSSSHITYDQLVGWLQLHEPAQLRQYLQAEMARAGLQTFILETLPTMNHIVGLAWQRGEIALVCEHVYTEILQDLLRSALATINKPEGAPRVLVTTPVGELHTFGILMLQVILALKGAYCMSLGAQTPVEDIAVAVRHFRVDLLCLSISCCYPTRKVVPLLKEIRTVLPQHTAFWAGGEGIANVKACPRGVKLIADFDGVADQLKRVLKQHCAQRNTGLNVADSLATESDLDQPMPAS